MRKRWLQNQDRVVRNLPRRRRGTAAGILSTRLSRRQLGQRYSYSSYWWRLQTCSAHFSAHQGSLGSNPYPVEVSLSHLCAQASVPSPQQPVTLKITKGPGETDTLGEADLKDPTHFFFFLSWKRGSTEATKRSAKGRLQFGKRTRVERFRLLCTAKHEVPLLFHYLPTVHAITRTSAQEPKSVNNGSL